MKREDTIWDHLMTVLMVLLIGLLVGACLYKVSQDIVLADDVTDSP